MEVRNQIVDGLALACKMLKYDVSEDEISLSLVETKPEFGDLASTIAFTIAKRRKKNPKEVAEGIARTVKFDPSLVEEIRVVGGYINLRYGDAFYSAVLEAAIDRNYGAGEPTGKKVVVEYPSVNPNKPWHVGHLRNALIGDSLSRILSFAGNNVERQNYINDLGLQVSQSIWGYLNLPKREDEKFDHLLGRQYVEVAKGQEEMEPQVRRLMKDLEAREPKISAIAREIAEKCVKAQYETAFNYGITHDLLVWESDIIETKLFEKVIGMLKSSGIFTKATEGPHAGCLVVKLNESEFPSVRSEDKVILRSDGTATYTAKDLAFQMWKFGIIEHVFKCKQFLKQPDGKPLLTTARDGQPAPFFGKADVVINIIGSEQSYPQDILKFIMREMGHKQAEDYHHVAYEHVVLPSEQFKGRMGTWIGYTADELLEEATKRAMAEVEKRAAKSGITEKEKERTALLIGLAAIKFSFLRITPTKQVIFEWDRALSFEGDTGPYVQYACVRAKRILEKLGMQSAKASDRYSFTVEEKELLKKIAQFPDVAKKAAKDLQCYYIAEYSLDLADAFSKFYETTPVLKAPSEQQEARAKIVAAAASVLERALGLIGIEVPEKM